METTCETWPLTLNPSYTLDPLLAGILQEIYTAAVKRGVPKRTGIGFCSFPKSGYPNIDSNIL